MGATRQPVECLDSLSLFATVGTGRLVAGLDRLVEPAPDCVGLPLDMAKSANVWQAQFYRPLGVESGARRAGTTQALEIRNTQSSSKGNPSSQSDYIRWVSVGDIRSGSPRCWTGCFWHHSHNTRQDMVLGSDGLAFSRLV